MNNTTKKIIIIAIILILWMAIAFIIVKEFDDITKDLDDKASKICQKIGMDLLSRDNGKAAICYDKVTYQIKTILM